MGIQFGRAICGDLHSAERREWLVSNGIGGYASGTIAGLLTRRYHGLLVAALKPPLGRTVLLTKLDEVATYDQQRYELGCDRWADGSVSPQGYHQIEQFRLVGTIPVWSFACADALLEKRIWMQAGANTTYIHYHLQRATQPLQLTIKALVNYRDYHSDRQNTDWQPAIDLMEADTEVDGSVAVRVLTDPDTPPLYLFSPKADIERVRTWYYDFDLAQERERGLTDREHHLHAATFRITLQPGESFSMIASTEPKVNLNVEMALQQRQHYEQQLLKSWHTNPINQDIPSPAWIQQLVLAADQFIVDRPSPSNPHGKTVLAGYPWFSDWGRDTMISLPGLTIATGRFEIARSILRTFAQYLDQGMLPNRFPDAGEVPEYNTVDATLWYFEALRSYYYATEDDDLLQDLFPVLADVIYWHCQGTRYQIHLDATDGLLYAGETGVQLTWMDAKVGDWVVTPRIGKPVEINALWYNALRSQAKFARRLNKPYQEYEALADRLLAKFHRFWNAELGYCYDVIDSPTGDDDAFRPNQLFAVSLPHGGMNGGGNGWQALLTPLQQRQVVDRCGQLLLTSYGLRSLSPRDANYQGTYGGGPLQRDGAYHQGTTWGWLIGAFVQAHLRVYRDPTLARQFLEPMAHHLGDHGLGSLSEIFDGNAPMCPQGCVAQAWTVAEVLRSWVETYCISA
ncbi:MAG: amylo-alpha-1,6-glucosidase [Synechococcales bacterium]|nr:amylo-alpha-1,6-glucosidase [Synechococcales bacterium]